MNCSKYSFRIFPPSLSNSFHLYYNTHYKKQQLIIYQIFKNLRIKSINPRCLFLSSQSNSKSITFFAVLQRNLKKDEGLPPQIQAMQGLLKRKIRDSLTFTWLILSLSLFYDSRISVIRIQKFLSRQNSLVPRQSSRLPHRYYLTIKVKPKS